MSTTFDYSTLLETAQSLISQFGRTVTLVRQSDVPADPLRPWGAPATTGTDTVSAEVLAVFLGTDRGAFPDVSAGRGGSGQTNVEQKTSRVLVAADASLFALEIGPEWRIDDGARLWDIVTSEPVQPGGTLIYYDLEVRG